MRLLDRYLLRELLVPLGYCLSGFLIFWVAFDLFKEMSTFQEQRVTWMDLLEYYTVITPEFLVVVLPIALLLAMLYSLTNHARHNEITAIRAAGISLWRLCLPYFAVGFLMTAASFAINELWAPNSSAAAELILERRVPPKPGALRKNQVRDLAFTNARHGRVWKISVYDWEKAEMLAPQVFWTQADGNRIWLKSQRALYTNDVWTFYGVTAFKETGGTNADLVPLMHTNVFAAPEFSETPEQIHSEISIAGDLGLRGGKKADIPITQILNYRRLHPQPSKSDHAWLETKLQGRLASPWTCMVVVLIAIPFGVPSGRRNVFVGVASSVFICFVYFVLQQLGLALGTGGHFPPWLAAWLPNILFGMTGLLLAVRIR
jgi:lipopolysaccharide export system permease protein